MPAAKNSLVNKVVSNGGRIGYPAAWMIPRPFPRCPPALYRSWAFLLAMLTWVASITKSVGVALHGLVGILPLFAIAFMVSVFEGSIKTILNNVFRIGVRNWLMVLLILWYAFGVFSKMYLWGASETDWRGVMDPVLLIFASLMGFGFMHEDRCARSFQIALIVAVGVQSIFSGSIMLEDPTLSRAAWLEMGGTWSYGDQRGFALEAMLLPTLVWRALVEKGVLRWLLLAGCAAISYSVIVCQFATAIALLVLSVPTAALLSLTIVKQQFFKVIAVSLCLLFVGSGAILLLRDTALMSPTVAKIERLREDPTSGGYSGREVLTASRWILAQYSFATFCKDPLFGSGSGSIRSTEVVGGHSSLFDMLGFYGLLGGGGAFIGLVLLLLMRALQNLRGQRNWGAVVVATSVVLFVIAGVVNPYWDGTIAIVLLVTRLLRTEERI
jgi:hypothetical protein